MRNRRNGPGGGTRRLHHLWGRNRIDVRNKGVSFARHGTTVTGLKKIKGTNQNRPGMNTVALNDNRWAAAAAAA
jgi:hypothetical protein